MSEEPPTPGNEESEPAYTPRVLAENVTLEMVRRSGPNVKARAEEWDELFGPMGTGWEFVTSIGEEGQRLQPIGYVITTIEGERYAREGPLLEESRLEEPEHRGGLKGYADDRKRRGLTTHLDEEEAGPQDSE
jgi:hypothetical protein